MRLWPKSLAGRLAALLILTLVVAQFVTFVLFSGERVTTLRESRLNDLVRRLGAMVELLEEAPPALRHRLVETTSSPGLRIELRDTPEVRPNRDDDSAIRDRLAEASGKRIEDVHVVLPPRWTPGRWWEERHGPGRGRHPPHPPPWVRASIRLADGSWVNIVADRPPVPPLGLAFLASFLISAVAVGAVGALGVRFASRPLRQLAGAADRLGRGESFDPLPESGPQETRRANIAFNRMRERIDRFVRDRTAMLAAVAHDLRTPITSMRLRAEFIEDEETKEKTLETLAEMQAMTEAVLAFVRGDAESEATRPTDVSALAESLVEDLAEGGRDVRFEDSPPVTLKCRPLALKRAVGNLIDNASFYGKHARVRVESTDDEVRVVIDDDGPGIPPAELERVFDPFVRLEGSRSRETGGAGLGLAIARSIARAHGGDVRLQNREGGGLRAVLSLPL
jgi:signal transduction histidine kinase